MIDNNKDDPEWCYAQTILAAGKIDVPAEQDAECNHFLSDLKFAAAMFKEAKRVQLSSRNENGAWMTGPSFAVTS